MFHYQWTEKIIQSRWIIPINLLLFVIGTDQGSKYFASNTLDSPTEIFLFNNIIQFSLIENYGGFLGVVNDLPQALRFFLLNIVVSFLLLGCLFYIFVYKNRPRRFRFSLLLVTGGGISNLLDRLFNKGGVTDFLSIGVGNLRTGIFNLADVYILVGSFVLGYLFFSSPEKNNHIPSNRH
ncbi:MAG: signal peptidase II [Desulforhopalus sp.]